MNGFRVGNSLVTIRDVFTSKISVDTYADASIDN